MVRIVLSLEEAAYLKSLVRSDLKTRKTKGPCQNVANDVYDLIVLAESNIIIDMPVQQGRSEVKLYQRILGDGSRRGSR